MERVRRPAYLRTFRAFRVKESRSRGSVPTGGLWLPGVGTRSFAYLPANRSASFLIQLPLKMSKSALLLAVFGLCTIRAITQSDAVVADTVTTDAVVVTAAKSPTPLRQTAKPLQIIPRSVIERNVGKDLPQLLQEQAGFIVNGAYSNPSKDKSLFLRGATNDLTLLLIDGQPIVDPSGPGGAIDLRLLPLAQIERIEILKGSQSTLYGSDAIAGVVNLITRKSGERPFGVYGNAAYGSLNTLNATAGVNGQASIFDYNVNVTRNSTDGISEARPEDDRADFDDDGFEQLGIQANLGVAVTEQLRIQPFFRYTDFDGDYDGGAFTDADNRFEGEVLNTGAMVQLNTPGVRANLNYSYTNTDRIFDDVFGLSTFEGRFHQVDAYANVPLGKQLEALVGANFQSFQLIGDSGTEVDPTESIVSPYLTLLYSPNNRLHAEVGYRYNNHSSFGSNSNVSVAAGYWLIDDFKVFGNFTTGFKAPTLSQLFGPFGANPDLDPQTSQSVELGLQYGTATGDLFGRATYFNRQLEDVIAFNFATGFFNQDEQNDQGLEIELNWQVLEALQLRAQYTYVTGEVTTPSGTGQDTTFNNLLRRPEHSFQVFAGFQPTEALFVSANAQYIGERTDLFFDPVTFAPSEVTLDAYVLLNLYAEYQLLSDRLTIFADVKNVLDADFSEVVGFNNLGFNILGGVRFRF